jgi:UDP-galactopyranose mutase
VNGYSELIEKLLDNTNITITLNKKFLFTEAIKNNYDHIFYTGPIDGFYDYKYGRLGYRTVTFEKQVSDGDHQGNPVINYCDDTIPYTRIHEHKHFTPWEKHEKTVYFKEFSKETGPADIPYYPKRLTADKELLLRYRNEAERQQTVSFLGRLATYRYMDMHHVIGEAIDFAKLFLEATAAGNRPPAFPNTEG